MTTQQPGPEESSFGANEWLVEELYEQFQKDPNSVDKTWWPVLQNYTPPVKDDGTSVANTATPSAEPAAPAEAAAPTASNTPLSSVPPTAPVTATIPVIDPLTESRTTTMPPRPQPVPAEAPITEPVKTADLEEDKDEPKVTLLKGLPKTLAANMDSSITMPTATTVRAIPAKLLIDNRIVINNHMKRARGGKISFTHIIGWAIIQALKEFPSLNVYYAEPDGKPAAVTPPHLNFGIAIDLPKPDGTRALVVPSIKHTEKLNFAEYVAAYEDLISRARAGKLGADDYAGTTFSLTNPGGIGTVHSVPRLMKGQSFIIGAGALEYPAEFQGMSTHSLSELGIGKIITLTNTYDHRVIQGAASGDFLRVIHELLIGKHGFYEDIFAALRIPYQPIQWLEDIKVMHEDDVSKEASVQELINAYRVRGHLMADIDPLEYVQRTHPDLEISSYGLTFWDLDREFVVGGFAGKRVAQLREVLGVLRDSYCRTIGIEYMHIQDPEQRLWFRGKLERPYQKPSKEEQLRILSKLNEAEAFETFLQTKYVGQKRFSLEGGESVIPMLDEILQGAANAQLDGAAIGMAHRGRLNVLTNIAGKTYGQVFSEFEGAGSSAGTGDVKYHLGTEGTFTALDGSQVGVYLAANPSHLETVNGVLEGYVRAKQDLRPIATFTTLPILIHGDAAMAGQGVVAETLQMSQLRATRTGGTIHIVINNQVGFTTLPKDSRSSVYSTDVAKTIQAPIFHVNGDDPEAVVRVAEIAFEYRQKFHQDVVIDLVCYRRRGHNEGDDPSMTQPLMYNLIEAKRSVRKLYAEALIGRGDITEEEFDKSQAEFQAQLEKAFADTHAAQTMPIPLQNVEETTEAPLTHPTAIDKSIIELVGDAHTRAPAGFTVHPKIQQLMNKRFEMSREGQIDWAFAELIAFGSLVVEGKPVRLVGQDSRRGTFVQRHAILHDRENGQEWLPLLNLTENQARFYNYDSLLSEYAALAFEYGYSLGRPEALVLWEAQFGDFVNGAQTVVDEYISSSEQKWGQRSGVVLLLPHGYEGQGPDHSSARIERFLQLAAADNMTIAQPSTPASYFHLLRNHAYAPITRPMIVFTPKSMLRLRQAVSDISDFTSGSFQPVFDDARITDPSKVNKVVLVSGKLYYDLLTEANKREDTTTALVRLEQYYPAPIEELQAVLNRYPNAKLVWAQDEPENQGAWTFMKLEVEDQLGGRTFEVASRPAAAAPAVGSAKRHQVEQAALIEKVFSL
ncbi:MAG: multifunctional oxoglutarate decarboxylase/oxoglutarate dehydrogenase thiamine pyrophosphate-binding subunit/dihydrolipoyllysine-residue succinyltransferase subunit [Microbacteriaceae bacterium]|nr:multifunctional oxoglutarate decarboxylase/oxoglutarate dehydrogenase thiamine pyrophosphate-binding subunit/dihydrolipoyllysine-residue succinyltransferase subunit [Microbacteriaceae bacterium]